MQKNFKFLSLLTAPGTNYVTGNNSVTFSWNALPSATYYDLLITSSTNSVTTTIPNISGTSHTYSFSTTVGAEEKFTWQVKAFNANYQTLNNTIRSLKIDHNAPFNPLLSKPLHLSTVKDTSSFRWSYTNATNDVKYDSIFIGVYPDSNFTSPIYRIVNRGLTINNSYSISPTLSSPTNTLIPSSYYYWKVKSIDSVGNVSPASTTYKFKLMN